MIPDPGLDMSIALVADMIEEVVEPKWVEGPRV